MSKIKNLKSYISDMPVCHGGDLVVVAHGPHPIADVAARRLQGDQLEADAAPEAVELGLRVGPGWQFNMKKFCSSFVFKNHSSVSLRFDKLRRGSRMS